MGDVIEGDGKHAKCSVSNLELLPETPAASGNIPRLVMPSLSLDTESCAASVETGGQSVLSRRETNESRRLNHPLTKFRATTSNSPKTLTGVSEDESVHAENAPSENDMSSDEFEKYGQSVLAEDAFSAEEPVIAEDVPSEDEQALAEDAPSKSLTKKKNLKKKKRMKKKKGKKRMKKGSKLKRGVKKILAFRK